MTQPDDNSARLGARGRLATAAAILLFLGAWLWVHPGEPWPANADGYEHLSAARNLLRGEGLSADVVYPLTTHWEWGRRLPQPMLGRPPGLSLLFVPAVVADGGDPARALRNVRFLQIALLLGIVWAGVVGLGRRGALGAAPAWLLLLLGSPLLGLAVDWGRGEVAAALLMMILWLRLRERDPHTTGVGTALAGGSLVALLTLVRTELVWVPVLWYLGSWVRRSDDPRGTNAFFFLRDVVLGGIAWLAWTLPWWIHVARVAGSPFFNPVLQALQLDLKEKWWEYPRLRGLEPLPLREALRTQLAPALLKVRHGLRFFAETLGHWLPWIVWAVGALLTILGWRRRRYEDWRLIASPAALLALTLVGVFILYGLFSQETRHMVALLPVIAWEIALGTYRALRRRIPTREVRTLALVGGALAALLLTPPELGGEAGAVAAARRDAPRVAALAAEVRGWLPGPVFTDNAAVCWLADRCGVWSPIDAAVTAEIRATVPGMRMARWVRLDTGDSPSSGK